MKQHIRIVRAVIALVLLTVATCQLQMSAGNYTINANTYYTITIVPTDPSVINASNASSANGWTIFTLPIDSFDSSQIAGAACSISCTKSGNNLNLSNTLYSSNVLQFNLTGIINPPSAVGPFFQFIVYTSAAVVAYEVTTTTITFSPGVLNGCTVSFLPNYVRKLGNATLMITPGNKITQGGSLSVRFPKMWAYTVNSDNVINSSIVSCITVSGSIGNNPICTVDSSSTVYTYVTVSNIFSSNTSSIFSLSISPVLSLPISYNSTEVSVLTQDANSYIIDNITSCTCQSPNPNTFTMTTATTTLVSKNFTPSIIFRSTDVINSNDTIRYTLPSQISFINTSYIGMSINDTTQTSPALSIDNANSNSTSNSYIIKPFTLNTKNYANANVSVTIYNAQLLAPPTSKPSGSIVFSFYRNGAMYSTGTISITALANTMTTLAIVADSQLVNAATSYNVSFTTASPISSTGIITIQIPTSITATDFAAMTCQISGTTNTSTTAICQMASNILTVSNAFTGIFPVSSQFSVYFNGVTNPQSTATTNGFRITTLYDSLNIYPVDFSSSLTFTASADTITSLTVSSGSLVVGAASIYTIVYTLKNHLPVGGTILLGLPIGMSLQNPSSASVSITVNGGSSFSSTPSIVGTSNGIYSSALNFTGLATTTTINAGSLITFQVSSIINPSSTIPSNSFSLYSYSQGSLIESLTSGVTITMTIPATFIEATIAANSNINGDSTFYIVSIMPSVPLPVGSILKITIPTGVTLTSPVCTNLTSTSSSLTCTVFGSILSISMSSTDAISTSVLYKYQVSGFTNPRTMTTSGNFTFACYTSDNIHLVAQSSVLGISNTLPNKIVSLTAQVVNPIQSYLNSSQTILFNLTTKNALTSTDYILLSYPSVYTYEGGSGSLCLEPTSNYNCVADIGNNLTVKITGNFNNQTVFSFHVMYYRSPALMQYINMSTYFMIYTKQVDNTDIDTTDITNPATQATFTISCDSNCKQCSTPITNCTSCYPSTITNYQYLQNSKCVSICAVGNYSDAATSSCLPCQSPCSTCTSLLICLSCLSNSTKPYFDTTTNNCVAVCPTGYYGSVNVCVPCSNLCKECSGTSTNCTKCDTTMYVFFNNTCVISCPTNYFNISSNCIQCDVSCLTCITSSTNCLLCASGYVTNGTAGVCTNLCPPGSVPYNGSCGCLVNCQTCSGTYNNCTSCNQSSIYAYFYQNSCYGSCPNGTYNNNQICTACPIGCSSCTSSSNCSSCNTSYYLYNNLCTATCPTGTFISISVCSACTSNCATCMNFASNCTSCITSYTLQGNVCNTSCTNGVPVSTNNGLICQACINNCSTCFNSVSNCTSCSSGTSLYNNGCVQTCPVGTTSVLGQCQNCVSPCLTCNISTSDCLSCRSGFYRVSQALISCVSDCSTVGLLINGTDCITCQSPCATCQTLASNCTSCTSGLYLLRNSCVANCGNGYVAYQGNCLASCPNGTQASNGTCIDSLNPSNNTNITNTTTGLNNTLTSSKIIPFPFFIADSVVIGLTLISKFSSPETSIACMGTSVGSLIEFASWAVVLVVVSLQDSQLYLFKRLLFTTVSMTAKGVLCILIGLVIHYLLNIINFIFYLKYIANDEAYQRWLKAPSHSRIHKLTLTLSLLLTHKFSHIPFSKCFGSSCFKAPLSQSNLFTPLNIIAGTSSIVSVMMIVGCVLIVYDTTTVTMSSLFIQAIDVIIVSGLLLLLGLWNLRKPQDFFDENSKLNTTSDQVYNDTLAGMINNQSEFGERFSVDEAEQGIVGKRNYSQVKSGSKISRAKQQVLGSRKRELYDDSAIPGNNSHEALNIQDMSSEYVSDQSDPRVEQSPQISKENNNYRNGQGSEDIVIKDASVLGQNLKDISRNASKEINKTANGNPKDSKDLKDSKESKGPKPKATSSIKPLNAKEIDDRNGPAVASQSVLLKVKKSVQSNPIEVVQPQQAQQLDIEQKKSVSIIDKMRDSEEFVVQQDEGLQVLNPGIPTVKSTQLSEHDRIKPSTHKNGKDCLVEDKQGKSGKPDIKQIQVEDKSGIVNSDKKGKSNKSKEKANKKQVKSKEHTNSFFNKTNKVGPMDVVRSEDSQKEEILNQNDEEDVASSEQRLHQNQIDWENANKLDSQLAVVDASTNPKRNTKRNSKSLRRHDATLDKAKSPKQAQGTVAKVDESESEQEKKEQRYGQNNQYDEGKDEQKANRLKPKPSEKSPKNKVTSLSKQMQKSMPSGLKDRTMSPKKSNHSVKMKPKLKSDNQASRSVKQKSLKIKKNITKQSGQQASEEGEENDQIDNINLNDPMLAVPNAAFPDTESDSYQSKTMNADSLPLTKNKKYQRQAHNYEDLSSQHVFNALANTSVIKSLDVPDEMPSKPRLPGKRYSNETGDELPQKQMKIDSDFVNKYYLDDQSLKSVEDNNVQFNEISPSEFNIQNQRYDESLDFPPALAVIRDRSLATVAPQRSDKFVEANEHPGHLISYYDTLSYKGSELDGSNYANFPKGLAPQRRQLPPNQMLYQRDPDQYKSISKLGQGGYDGIYQKVQTNGENHIANKKKVQHLQKIYLQRLDVKADNKRRSINQTSYKKKFLEQS